MTSTFEPWPNNVEYPFSRSLIVFVYLACVYFQFDSRDKSSNTKKIKRRRKIRASKHWKLIISCIACVRCNYSKNLGDTRSRTVNIFNIVWSGTNSARSQWRWVSVVIQSWITRWTEPTKFQFQENEYSQLFVSIFETRQHFYMDSQWQNIKCKSGHTTNTYQQLFALCVLLQQKQELARNFERSVCSFIWLISQIWIHCLLRGEELNHASSLSGQSNENV